jgi:hypothetical protein
VDVAAAAVEAAVAVEIAAPPVKEGVTGSVTSTMSGVSPVTLTVSVVLEPRMETSLCVWRMEKAARTTVVATAAVGVAVVAGVGMPKAKNAPVGGSLIATVALVEETRLRRGQVLAVAIGELKSTPPSSRKLLRLRKRRRSPLLRLRGRRRRPSLRQLLKAPLKLLLKTRKRKKRITR